MPADQGTWGNTRPHSWSIREACMNIRRLFSLVWSSVTRWMIVAMVGGGCFLTACTPTPQTTDIRHMLPSLLPVFSPLPRNDQPDCVFSRVAVVTERAQTHGGRWEHQDSWPISGGRDGANATSSPVQTTLRPGR